MKKIQVLLSTYNGERYLKEQIDSILTQVGVEVQLFVRDDGSKDGTLNILNEYSKKGKLSYVQGINVGYRKSFLWLLDHSTNEEYYAFADQDDVWEKNKLKSAIDMLESEDSASVPLLYTSALTCVDEKLEYLRTQNFEGLILNAYSEVVRHRFAGCTYVFNKKLRDISVGLSDVESMNYGHDGYLCMMCWFAKGKVIFDENSHIKFRRHGDNASPDGLGKIARIKNELAFLNVKKNQKSKIMTVIWDYKKNEIAPEYLEFVDDIAHYKTKKGAKLSLLQNKRLNCGIRMANVLFKFSILIGCM